MAVFIWVTGALTILSAAVYFCGFGSSTWRAMSLSLRRPRAIGGRSRPTQFAGQDLVTLDQLITGTKTHRLEILARWRIGIKTDLVRSLTPCYALPVRYLSRIRWTCGSPVGGSGEWGGTCRCHLPRIVDSHTLEPDRGYSRTTVGLGGVRGLALAWSCRPLDEAARATWLGRKLRRPKQKQQRPT